ncbi:DUF4192 domain-containing protein [Actinotalea sp. C106]|uniref:DUF4192 domain-containing protein n=1 Tax=Actinotalea sp. C106 TaxID=2908644 RepID=UPI002028F0F1|nr:DUF4192 domain-containing protein [Actinotalea sp. C106]
MQPTVTITGPREILATVTYQLGFTPTDSLVLVSLRGDRQRIGLVARIDLDDAPDAATALAGHLVTDGASAAFVIAYTPDPVAAHTAAAHVESAVRAQQITPLGTWWVTGTEYRAINPHHPHHSESTGHALDLDTTVVAATLVAEGVAVRGSRADLAITPAPQPARDAARDEITAAIEKGERVDRVAALGLWRQTLATGAHTPAVAGRLAHAMTDILVRDAILCDLIPHGTATADAIAAGTGSEGVGATLGAVLDPVTGTRPDPATTDPAAALLAHVAAHVDSAAALTLLGFLSWWDGDGARANVHLEATHQVDPTYRLAALIGEALDAGMAPGWIRAGR